jgi:hypothetical protein
MEQSAVKQKVGTLTTVEMVEREGEAPEIELLTHGEELPAVETLIRVLGALRGELQPPTSASFPRGPVQVAMGCPISVERAPNGEHAIGICHPGFGWLWFHLDAGAREYLLRTLEA